MLDFEVSDIIKAIEDIKPNAAPGPDDIPVMLLRNCKDAVAEPIHLIWKMCFSAEEVPSLYKFSHVFPLYKKDSRAMPTNYRPIISLTSHIIKIFERVIRKKMVDYLEMNELICNRQHGFRAGRSCLTQLLHHFDDVLESVTNNSDFDSIYLDNAKAFDKVDHKLLLKKLQIYGVHSRIIRWIESFLKNHKQAVVVDGHLSVPGSILCGVPQGTVLGPILFLVFINDVDRCIRHSIIRCFADDTRISIAITSEQDVMLLQSDLHNVIVWSSKNNMALHKDKFEYMCHKFNKNHAFLELPFVSELYKYSVSEETSLEPIHQLRDLVVLVASNLSWSPHIRSITDKARQKASWVLSVFHTHSPAIMLTLYKSMVRSIVEYCCPLWNPTKTSDIQELEIVQKTFIARIAGMRDMHYLDCLIHLSLMSLQRRRERFIILHMWKLLNNITSYDLNIQFVTRSRFGNLAIIPSSRKNRTAANQSLFDNSFAVQGPKLWNAIPYHLNVIQDLQQVKDRLTKFMLSLPDKPPIRGYATLNSNSLLCGRNDRGAISL